jgi:hypothetical protein
MDASQMTCPKCGWVRELSAVECPACGIVYARYSGASARPAAPSAFAPPPAPSPSLESVNPYAPPRSELQSAPSALPQEPQLFGVGGVWRTGDLLVMQKGTTLPNRCLVCNQPASVQFPKKMYWHHPGLYFLILLSFPIYLIAVLISRKKADVVLPLCTEHETKRKKATTTANLMMLFGFLAILGGCFALANDGGGTFGLVLLAGFLVLLAGAIVLSVGANLIIPKKIDDYYVWLRKVTPAYLAALPPAPPGL